MHLLTSVFAFRVGVLSSRATINKLWSCTFFLCLLCFCFNIASHFAPLRFFSFLLTLIFLFRYCSPSNCRFLPQALTINILFSFSTFSSLKHFSSFLSRFCSAVSMWNVCIVFALYFLMVRFAFLLLVLYTYSNYASVFMVNCHYAVVVVVVKCKSF